MAGVRRWSRTPGPTRPTHAYPSTPGSGNDPVGVRLELVGDADVIEIAYRTETEDLGQRGRGGVHLRLAAR